MRCALIIYRAELLGELNVNYTSILTTITYFLPHLLKLAIRDLSSCIELSSDLHAFRPKESRVSFAQLHPDWYVSVL